MTGVLTVKAVPVTGSVIVTVTAAETNTLQETSTPVVVRINKAPLTIRASDITAYVFDGVPDLTNPQPNVDYTVEGFVNGEGLGVLETGPTLTYQKGGAPTIPFTAIVGTYDIVPAGADAGGNYAISYAKGTLTVKDRKRQVITASDVNVTYGEAGRYIGATTNGDGVLSYLVKGDAITVDASGMITAYRAGTAYVTITAAGTDNYTPAVKEVRVTVNKAQLTVTAKDEQIYAGETPEGFYDVSGLTRGDQLTTPPTLTYLQNGAEVDPQAVPAGNYDIVPSGADAGGKYTVSYVNGTLTVRGEQSVTASDVTATYGDKGVYVKAATTGDGALSFAVKEGSEFIDVNGTTGEITIKRAGAAIVTVTAAETSGHARAAKDVMVTINKKSAIIQADDKSKHIDSDATPESLLSAQVYGVVNGDNLAYELKCDCGSGAGSWPIHVVVDPIVNPNHNYEIETKDGTFSVTSTNMGVAATGWSGVYDGKPHGINVQVAVPDGETYTVEYGTVEGVYDSETSPTKTDVGTLRVYYKVTTTAGADAVAGSKDVVIGKATITPSVSIQDWKWGEKPNAPVLGDGSNPGGGTVTYEYARRGGSNWSSQPPTAAGDYTLLATIPETTNYFSGTAMANFSVTPVEATLTFDLGGGAIDGKTDAVTVKANCGDTVALAVAPTKDGHTFKAWKDSAGKTYAAGAEYKVEGDHSFVAEWEEQVKPDPDPDPDPTKATLTFDFAGGTLDGKTDGATVEATVGETATLLAAPVRDGYNFKAWKDSENKLYAAGGEYTVVGDHAFVAEWEKQADPSPVPDPVSTEASLTFDLGGGTLNGQTGTITIKANRGDTIKLPDAPTRDGYVFKYWKGSQYAAGAEYKVEGDHAFTAEWEQRSTDGSASVVTPGGSGSVTVPGGSASVVVPGGTASVTIPGGSASTSNNGGASGSGGSASVSTPGGGIASASSSPLAGTSDPTTLVGVAVAAGGAIAAVIGLTRKKR